MTNLLFREKTLECEPGRMHGVFSAKSCSPHVIKIFVPVIRHCPSSLRTACVEISLKSEPASDSVRFIVPHHSPVTSFRRYRARCSSDPHSERSSTALWVNAGFKEKARLADAIIS